MMNSDKSRLILSDLPKHITDDALKDHFSQFGELLFCMILEGADETRPNTGILRYSKPESASSALSKKHVISNTEIFVARPDHLVNPRKIFIGALPHDLTDEELRNHFKEFGTIIDHVIIREAGLSKGFGFVTYDEAESAKNALRKRPHVLKGKEVDAKQAIPRSLESGNRVSQ